MANLLLDDLDRELERRGHAFCRYADDCNVYVRSEAAGQRVMASLTTFLEGRLRLRVNRKKSAVAPVGERTFLGHRVNTDGTLDIAPDRLARIKERLRRITRRNRGAPVARMIAEVNAFATGWVTYFRHARPGPLRRLDEWLRRRLRCVRLCQCRSPQAVARFLRRLGVRARHGWPVAPTGLGWWAMARSPQAHAAMPTAWFQQAGLLGLAAHHAAFNTLGNRRGT